MKEINVIVIASKAKDKNPCPLSCAEVLFEPLYTYTLEALKKAGFEKICVFGDVEDSQNSKQHKNAVLSDVLEWVLGLESEEFLLMYGDVTYLNAQLLQSAVSRFREDKIPALITDEDTMLSAGMLISKEQVKKLDKNIKSLHNMILAFENHMKYTVTANRVLNAKRLLNINEKARESIINKHLENGVLFNTLYGITITKDVVIEPGALIKQGSIITGKSEIKSGCIIGPDSRISDSIIGENSHIQMSCVASSKIGENVTIGPYSNIRGGCAISDNVHIGDFVEVKNSNIQSGTKIAHLTYVGDSDIGKNVNFGCGTVTVNYDGKNKMRTVVEDNVFIGCNTNLIAPVLVEENSYIAAGSTITETVPKNSLAIARARQINKENWKKK